MPHERDVDLMGAFWSLHAAHLRHEGLEQRLRQGETGQDLLDRSLAAAEAVVAARSALHRCLMRRGWTPPKEVVIDLVQDEWLLSESDGAVHG